MEKLCKLMNIKQTFASTLHPESNGLAKRLNQQVIKSLRLICDDQTEWASKLTPVLMSYRASVISVTGLSPYFALFGREMKIGIDLALLSEFEKFPNIQAYTKELLPKLKLTHDIIKQNTEDSDAKSKLQYDKKTQEPTFELGSKVLIFDPTTKIGECAKLKRKYKGPYVIVFKSSDGLSYQLRDCNTGKELRSFIHSNRLKAYNEDDRDRFYTRNMVTPKEQKQSPSITTDLGDDWHSIDKVTSRKKVNGKDTYLVHWTGGGTSRELAENITDYAKAQYFIALKQKQGTRRRRKQ